MGGSYLGDAGSWLVATLFDLYILVVMLRLLFQLVRADFYNPVSQFVVRATTPVLRPLRRVIPGIGGIDVASLVLLLALTLVKWWVTLGLQGQAGTAGGLFFLSVADLLSLLANIYLVTILVQVVLSWVSPGVHHPVTSLLYSLNEPLLRPARRLLPPMSGFDLSPLLVLIALQLASMLVVAPIRDLGRALM